MPKAKMILPDNLISKTDLLSNWVGDSEEICKIRSLIIRNQGFTLPMLISGETGSGKSLLVELFHFHSKMSDLPLHKIKHSSLSQSNFQKLGEGTFWVDKIEILSAARQNEFLSFLNSIQDNRRIRFIVTSDYGYQDLEQYKMLRQGLLQKLAILKIHIPPLRERAQDISLLIKHHLVCDIGLSSMVRLLKNYPYDWPGNIQELIEFIHKLQENEGEHLYEVKKMQEFLPKNLERTKNFHQNLEHHIKEHFSAHEGKMLPAGLYQRIIREVEKILIEQTLEVTQGNQIKASRVLGLHRNTLRKKIAELL